MALGINIVSGFDGRGIEKALKEFAKLETTGQRAQFALQKAALPAAAALAGVAAAAGLAVKGAIADQQEQAKLAQSLRATTGATQAQIAANEDYLRSLEMTTLFNNKDMRPALASLVQANGDLQRSQKDLQLAMDISVSTGIPLVQVADALSKAYNDNFKSLKALNPALNDNIRDGQSLDQIFQELTNTFGGATAAASQTAAGQFAILRNQLEDLADNIGMMLLPIVQAIIPAFQKMASFANENRVAFLVVVGAIAAFSAAIVAASAVVKVHTTYQKLMKIETLANSAAFKAAGTTAIGFGTALGGLMIAQTLAPLINNLTGATGRAETAFKKTGAAINDFNKDTGTSQEVLTEFINTAQAELRKFDPMGAIGDVATFKGFGREFQLVAGDIKLDIEVMDKTFKGFADASPEYAQSIVNAMKAQLAITDPTSRAYKDLQDAIARYEGQLRTAKGAQDALNGAIANTPRVIPLTGALARLESQTQREFKARQASADALQDWNTKANAAFSSASKAAESTKTAKEKLEEFTGALRANFDAQRSLTSAQRNKISADNALKSAIESTAKAQDYFNKVSKGFAPNSKEAIDATERYADATRRLRDANIRLRDATESQTDAEKQLIRLRQITANAEDVADAERNLERSKYRVEEANFAVTDAEAKLAELRADPKASAIDIRRAEIDLAEAKLAVKDSVRAVADAEAQLANEVNRKATAEEIADAERDLQKAKMQVADATEEVEDATKNEIVAQAFLNEILYGAKEGTDAYRDALDELTQAKESEEGARRAVAEAILAEAEATLSLAKAIDELNTVQAKTPAGIVRRGQEQLAGISTTNPALGLLNTTGGGQGDTTNFNMTVNAGMGTDADQVAREIIDVLKSYERANGVIPLITEYQIAI